MPSSSSSSSPSSFSPSPTTATHFYQHSDSGHEGTPSPAPASTVSPTPPALPPRPLNLLTPSSSRSALSQQQPPPPHIANSYAREAARMEAAAATNDATNTRLLAPNRLLSVPTTATTAARNSSSHQQHQQQHHHQQHHHHRTSSTHTCQAFGKKYVLLCSFCGGLCLLLGTLYLAIFFILDNYTTSLHYFQTLPTYVPSVPLIVTGLLIICFARKRNRNNHLLKICGCLCLGCAVLCVVVTVTTTVIHMNRLQTLRECAYMAATQTCTCFAAAGGMIDPFTHEGGIHYIFSGTQSCDVIHGVLYSCLRALFGISVIGILICIFSSMLVYQLLSHEKKKEYWAQLESRCRFLHRRMQPPHAAAAHHRHHHFAVPAAAAAAHHHHHHQLLSSISGNLNSQCECCSPAAADTLAACEELYCSTPNNDDGNIYSPNPEQALTLVDDVTAAAGGAETRGSTTSSSLSSFRNWLRRSRLNIVGGGGDIVGIPSAVTHRPCQQQHLDPLWRRSHPTGAAAATFSPESTYGFQPARIYPASCHYISSLSQQQQHSGLSNSSSLVPQYVWDPPPPYSQPYAEAAAAGGLALTTVGSNNGAAAAGVQQQQQSQAIQTTATSSGLIASRENLDKQQQQQQSAPRTTKSGLLLLPNNSNAANKKNYCYSLPSRRVMRKQQQQQQQQKKKSAFKSAANLPQSVKDSEEEAALVREVRQKLNTLLLYKYQHSKASRELAEVREALHKLQSLSSPVSNNTEIAAACEAVAAAAEGEEEDFYGQRLTELKRGKEMGAALSVVRRPAGRNRNSTSSGTSSIENKYETIEKSLSPYKIDQSKSEDNQKHQQEQHRTVQVSIRKQLLQLHQPETSSRLRETIVDKWAKGNNNNVTSISPSFSSSSSSHYAQISPLRGAGLPRATPTYFQEICGRPPSSTEKQQQPTRGSNYFSSPSSPTAANQSNNNLFSEINSSSSNHISNSDPKLFQFRPKVMPRSNATRKLVPTSKSAPNTPEKRLPHPVYLRPEQNIPEIFSSGTTGFQPIGNSSSSSAVRNKEMLDPTNSSSSSSSAQQQISRDDIVVTVRSAQV